MNNIEFANVFFSYQPDKPILQGLNIIVEPNEIVGLLGANGSGKTTTFKLLSGLLAANTGYVKISGKVLNTSREKAPRKFAYVPDEPLLYPHFSALENMNLFALLWGVESHFAQLRTEELLKEVGLWEVRNQWVESYSRGMKQKLSICAAILHEPQVLIMDEPFSGLDTDSLLWARDMLKAYVSKERRSIIFTSHTPEVVESVASRVIVLKSGKIIHDQPLDGSQPGPDLVNLYKHVISISN